MEILLVEIHKPARDVKDRIDFTYIREKVNKKVFQSKSTGPFSFCFRFSPTGKKNDKKNHKLQTLSLSLACKNICSLLDESVVKKHFWINKGISYNKI